VEELIPMADEVDISLAEYALAWILTNLLITALICGPRTMEQLEGLLRVPEIRIPAEHLGRIDHLVPSGTDV
jgi:aryl-alcohol dehydrogenase-like predicted oxidoreductase